MKAEEEVLRERAAAFGARTSLLRERLHQVVVGQDGTLELLIVATFADGHALLEGPPGLGKTLMVKSLSQSLSLQFNRIQFTPDLMPADITGTTVITTSATGQRSFTFEPGPLFTNILLADEINRAGPKTQSALLQAMQEREVSLFGRHYPLTVPFLVFATQNPIELAGTYPLPEAQLDRFLFKVLITPPGAEELMQIAERTTGGAPPPLEPILHENEIAAFRALVREIPVARPVLEAATRGIMRTRPQNPESPELVRRYVRYGVSPRGLQAVLLAAKVRACLEGRFNVSLEDVRHFWLPALRHRVILDVSAGLDGVSADRILEDIVLDLPRA
jgi:MoxR-like ATPase